MKFSDIAIARLLSQQIESSKFKSAKQLVSYMGAIQAQDYAMAKFAVGLRLQYATGKKIEKAIHNGEIIRTHLMRPTWHFVAADDIYWMLELTAPQMIAGVKSRHKFLGLTETIIFKANNIIEKSLRDGNHLTREELMQILSKAKIPTEKEMPVHIMYRAETDGIACSGRIKNNKQTYALLAERVPKNKTITKDDALALLAKKYFTSHCPATLKDFIWWSGLPVKDATHALEMIKKNFSAEKINNEIYWLPDSFVVPKLQKDSVHLLPAYDEFLISYKNRTASLLPEHQKNTLSANGIFWPIIVVNGNVIGKWKRSVLNKKLLIETEFFTPKNKAILSLIQEKAKDFGKFLGNKSELIIQ